MIKIEKRKNILDLKYNKYVQYYNTTILIIFTYIIGLIIAITTQEMNFKIISIIIFISIIFLGTNILVLFQLKDHQKNILKEIQNL